ncbi:hypothetical protein C8F04DRAFT_1036704 [Mycena alexandri]|uniref:Uncharacterized protein n=1 Tax=Mycena alexandri TaxID=1745969 RepID=A0AAD6X8X0_9AGAR|nr:hypothetical protein C8F04DRAFT_1036704 [Mycena alexandri]
MDQMRQQMQTLQRTYNELKAVDAEKTSRIETNDTAMAALRAKYDAVKADKKALRAASNEAGVKTGALEEELSQLTAQNEALQTETEELKETLREMIELVESPEAEDAKAQKKYREYMQQLPAPQNLPPYAPPSLKRLKPVCFKDTNIHGYFAEDARTKSFLNHVLYLPKRITHMCAFQYIAYGPTHRYDRTTGKWIEGSDLIGFDGGIRELFLNSKNFVVYVGSYKCHDLGSLEPNGISLPSHISLPEMMDVILGVPWPPGHAKLIKERYPDGVRVRATGLQCVGFSNQLYESLHKRFAHERAMGQTSKKRKAEDEDLRRGGKVQKKT